MDKELEQIEAELAALGESPDIPIQSAAAPPQQNALVRALYGSIPAIRGIGGMGANLAGGIVGAKAGAALGTPFAPFTLGLSIPAGGIIGGALGGYGADVGYGTLADIAEERDRPLEDISAQAAKEAQYGATIETGLRALGYLAPPVARTAGGIATRVGATLVDAMGPGTVSKAEDVAADVLTKLKVTPEVIEKGLKETNIPNPTLAQTVKTAPVGAVEAELATSAAGAQSLLQKAAGQTEALESPIKSLVPENLKGKTQLELGKTLQKQFRAAREKTYQALSKRYDAPGLLDKKVPLGSLDKQVDQYLNAKFGDQVPSAIEDAANQIKSLIPKAKQVSEPRAIGFGADVTKKAPPPEAKPEALLKEVQTVRSGLLKKARASDRQTQQHILGLVDELNTVIDNIPGAGKELKKLNGEYKEFVNTYFRSPLSDSILGRTERVKPETVFRNLQNNAQATPIFENVFGKITPTKAGTVKGAGALVIADKIREFERLNATEDKLRWIYKNENQLRDTNVWPRFQEYLDINAQQRGLTDTASFGATERTLARQLRQQAIQEAGLSSATQRVLRTGPSEMPRAETVASATGSQIGEMLKGALRSIAQRIGGATGQGALTTTVAGISGIPMSVAIPAGAGVAIGSAGLSASKAKRTALLGEQLSKAFTNPEYAAELLRKKQQRDAARKLERQSRLLAERQFQQMALQPSPLLTGATQTLNIPTALDEINAELASAELDEINAELASLGE